MSKNKQQVVFPDSSEGYYDEWRFSPGVKSNGFVFVSGCTGSLADGTLPKGIRAQTRQAFAKIKKVLGEAELSFSGIVEMTTYHVNLNVHLDGFREAKDEFIVKPYPAWTAIGVSELALSEALIEIRVIAQCTDT